MKKEIKKETDIARRLLALLRFPGDETVEVIANVRIALRNIDMLCDAMEEEDTEEQADANTKANTTENLTD